jgi:hypothetical protein
VQGEIYILVWGYIHELICIVTNETLKLFIVIYDRLIITQVKYYGCGLLLHMKFEHTLGENCNPCVRICIISSLNHNVR